MVLTPILLIKEKEQEENPSIKNIYKIKKAVFLVHNVLFNIFKASILVIFQSFTKDTSNIHLKKHHEKETLTITNPGLDDDDACLTDHGTIACSH